MQQITRTYSQVRSEIAVNDIKIAGSSSSAIDFASLFTSLNGKMEKSFEKENVNSQKTTAKTKVQDKSSLKIQKKDDDKALAVHSEKITSSNTKSSETVKDNEPLREDYDTARLQVETSVSARDDADLLFEKDNLELSENSVEITGIELSDSAGVIVSDTVVSGDTDAALGENETAVDTGSITVASDKYADDQRPLKGIILSSGDFIATSERQLTEDDLIRADDFERYSNEVFSVGAELGLSDDEVLGKLVEIWDDVAGNYNTRFFKNNKDIDMSALRDFLKGNISLSELVSAQKTAALNTSIKTDVTSDPVKESLDSLMKEAGVTEISLDENTLVENSDFDVETFKNIEESLKTGQILEDNLKSLKKAVTDNDSSRISSEGTQSKSSANDNVSKSLEVLKAAASKDGSDSEMSLEQVLLVEEGSENYDSFNDDAITEFKSTLEEAKATLSSAMSGEGDKGSSKGGYHSSHNNLFSSLNGIKEVKSQMTASASQSSNDLLTLSKNLKENAEALSHKINEMAARNLKSLNLTLNPQGMGKMKITIDATSADEISKITIAASYTATKSILEQGMQELRELLFNSNINAETEVESYDERHHHEQEKGGESKDEREQNQKNPDDFGTLFADTEDDEDVSLNRQGTDEEYVNNSQNSNSVSYFS
ncbi:MAG: flagellar hook-length control protein FliK [Succinivibrio sp.]